MSSRRAARAGIVTAAARRDGLPVELTSRHHECWTDPAAVADLAGRYGLRLNLRHYPSAKAAPWWARFDAFRAAWCEANGLMHPDYRNTLDWRRCREDGIDMSASSRYRLAFDRATLAGQEEGRWSI